MTPEVVETFPRSAEIVTYSSKNQSIPLLSIQLAEPLRTPETLLEDETRKVPQTLFLVAVLLLFIHVHISAVPGVDGGSAARAAAAAQTPPQADANRKITTMTFPGYLDNKPRLGGRGQGS